VAGDFFGAAVAVAGERVVVGAFGRAAGQGAAFVFERDGDGWVQVQALGAEVPAEMEQFGKHVALRGDRVVVSGQGFEQAPMVGSRGGAYLFSHDDASDEGEAQGDHFRLLAALRADDGVPGDTLGVGTELTDREVFLGAPFDDAPAQPAPDLSKAPGSAYLFGLTQAIGEPCGRDEDCGPAALCCALACAAVDACEPAAPTTGGPGSSSGGETPTSGAATTGGSTSTGAGEVPEAQFEPGDAGCACDAEARGGDMIEMAGVLVLTMLLRRRRGARPVCDP
jgi:hypothetical protein